MENTLPATTSHFVSRATHGHFVHILSLEQQSKAFADLKAYRMRPRPQPVEPAKPPSTKPPKKKQLTAQLKISAGAVSPIDE